MSPFGHRERLVERSREVETTWADNGVLARIAEARVRPPQPCRDRSRELGGIEPLVLTTCRAVLLGVVNLAVDVRTVGVAGAVAVQANRIVADRHARTLVVARGLVAAL